MTARAVIAVIVLVLMGGCATAPIPPAVDRSMPAQWRTLHPSEMAWPPVDWWRSFGSAELVRLIESAERNNRDLAAAGYRIAQARALLRVAQASLFPTVDASAAAARAQSGRGLRVGDSFDVALAVNYEIDVWGFNRASREAASAALAASGYARETSRITVIADTAAAYFQILSLNDRLAVAERQLGNARELLRLLEVQYQAGAISRLELERQRNLVATQEAAIPPIIQQREQTLDALGVLLGVPAQDLRGFEGSLTVLSLPAISPGLPSTLLVRRPDIRRAEADLVAANADLAAARAALLPRFDLTARGGFQAATLSELASPSALFWSLAAAVAAPLFDAGKLAAQRDAVEARRNELIEQYRQAILISLREVEDALVALDQLAQQEAAQARALEHAQQAYRLVELRWRAGSEDFTTVLDAQRSLISAESSLVPIRSARFSATVALFKALGGDWNAIVGPGST